MADYPYGYCGMPCALCTRYHINGSSRCEGCSKGGYYTDVCKVHGCCTQKGLAHCGACTEYPCRRLGGMGDFRDLNTGGIKPKVCAQVNAEGFAAWYARYCERASLLSRALERYNDGRMKRFLCELFIQRNITQLRALMCAAESLQGDQKELGRAFRMLAGTLAPQKE